MIILADAIEAYLSNYPEEIRKVTKKLRDTARHAMSGAHEFLYYETISYSLTNSPIDRIFYISPMEKQVTLGFQYGAQLKDQDHLLQGTSKRARHIWIKTSKEAGNSALGKLVKEAWTQGTNAVSRWKQQLRRRRALARQRARSGSRVKRSTRSQRRRR